MIKLAAMLDILFDLFQHPMAFMQCQHAISKWTKRQIDLIDYFVMC